ncbi:MAG: AAA family ATPase, partial [Propionibacteriaceae bacterium]|nr:AAA family ATPase [Propionibacteriaceae bacterium]
AEHRTLYAQRGFNVIGTANTRDRGVNDMSAALKRRFNFETIGTIENLEVEMALVERETDAMLQAAEIPTRLGRDATEVLVRVFRELRTGRAGDEGVERLTSAMSTAEAVSTGMAAAVHAAWFGADTPGGKELAEAIVASALKDEPEDLSRLRAYRERYVKKREGLWTELYRHLP